MGFKDQATTMLTQSIRASDATFTVSYGLDLAAGSMITVNSEQMCIGSSTATSVTLASSGCTFNSANGRGVNGTTAASHSRGVFSRTTGITVPTWEAGPVLAYKSIHPVFTLYFIPSQKIVKISCVLDNGWIGRA